LKIKNKQQVVVFQNCLDFTKKQNQKIMKMFAISTFSIVEDTGPLYVEGVSWNSTGWSLLMTPVCTGHDLFTKTFE